MKDINMSLKVAAVFIGTVVGAGLASGQEILQFFTLYGFHGVLGILVCGLLYIAIGAITVDLSYKYKASSYNDLIYLSCGKYLGSIVDFLTTMFLFAGTCIILSGSGSVFSESFGLPAIAGVLIMAVLTMAAVLNSIRGLIFINSIIVPSMITVVAVISTSVLINKFSMTAGIVQNIINAPIYRDKWLLSTLLYVSFNMLSATGVLSPMTEDIKNTNSMFNGVAIGALGLFLLTSVMNVILLLNEPNVFNYSIPMLYIAGTVGTYAKVALSTVIWLEMFSTAVSDVYSLSKKLSSSFKMDYGTAVIIILISALPFTYVGFKKLIEFLYPAYGAISLIYIICLFLLYFGGNQNGKQTGHKK